jgi:hypothetical protein
MGYVREGETHHTRRGYLKHKRYAFIHQLKLGAVANAQRQLTFGLNILPGNYR